MDALTRYFVRNYDGSSVSHWAMAIFEGCRGICISYCDMQSSRKRFAISVEMPAAFGALSLFRILNDLTMTYHWGVPFLVLSIRVLCTSCICVDVCSLEFIELFISSLNSLNDLMTFMVVILNSSLSQLPYGKALYSYEGKEPGDLKFNKGDIIILRRKVDENWYHGELQGTHGFLPASYIQCVRPLPQALPQGKALYDFEMKDRDQDKDCLTFTKAVKDRTGILSIWLEETVPGGDRHSSPPPAHPLLLCSLKPLVPSQGALQASLLCRACPELLYSIQCVLVLCCGKCNFLVSAYILAKKTGSK
ncbi:hypothetical protein STEG23_008021 [Scotinomys teguina]